MQIVVNGLSKDVPQATTLLTLLDSLNIPLARVAVELNMNIIDRTQFDKVSLQEGDRLEVIHFVGGGGE